MTKAQQWSKDDYFGIDIPFMRLIGLEPVSISDDQCVTYLPLTKEITNSRGEVHGGVLLGILDFTMSAAARGHDPLKFGSVTVEMGTHFLEKGETGLTVMARCLRRGRSLVYCEGEVRGENDVLVAKGNGTFKLIPASNAVS
ncbi:PaaI family thioesterase (plasmid) [Agrobacterium leguminum]|uniref:Thioesterase domain-containing protein n=1 Tax=Agrobacterium deltaense NCPPB 1641 TaxID=1183425 RepID=A0A1S7U8Y9_9HYPH|nr:MULTISPECIES: PaaI family thioesterase [Agrobacterium]WFS70063.1 PaaI family thioesterase [Agrobacterium leguminum]CVI63394.1 conserved hypothetical protein [Agrobacterium deltaense NCPPB 1641]